MLLDAIKIELPVLDRSMLQLANIPDRDLVRAGMRDRKTNRVPIALTRKMRTSSGISQIAEIVKGGVRWGSFLPRRGAATAPTRSQRQAQRMEPGAVVHNLPRHKIGTGQALSPENRYCSARHDINEVISIEPEARTSEPEI